MARIPDEESDTPAYQQEGDKYAQHLPFARRETYQGVAGFVGCVFELIRISHIFSHPERSRRTLSHIIMDSRLSPTGQGATHAPHWKHERAKRATGVEIGPDNVSRLSTSMVMASSSAGQASRHSLQPMQATSSCATWGPVLCKDTVLLPRFDNPVRNI